MTPEQKKKALEEQEKAYWARKEDTTKAAKMKMAVHGGVEPVQCEDELCIKYDGTKTLIEPGDTYFIDYIYDKQLCSQCGECLRYARKMAAKRGEPIELAEV